MNMQNRGKGINWEPIPGPICNGDRITCHIGDTVVSGRVFVSPKTLCVSIDFPVDAGMVGKSIDMLTPIIFTESIEEGSPASWYGLCIARELLLAQYYGKVEEKA